MPYKSKKQMRYMEMLRANPGMKPRSGERPPMTVLGEFHREAKKAGQMKKRKEE